MKKIFSSLFAVVLCFSVTPSGADQVMRSGPFKVSLVEAYTSEGCSSCVPAWRRLSQLNDDPGLWNNFVPVGFHVDYWDYLGWKDPLAQKRFSDRQHAYAAFWGKGSIYTPGFVLNGKEWRSWNDPKVLNNLSKELTGNLNLELKQDNVIRISFHPQTQNREEDTYTAHIALLAFGVVSDIAAGENSGRKAKHDFAVVAYTEERLTSDFNGTLNTETKLEFPANRPFPKKGIAVWVTRLGDMTPIQTVGGIYN